MNKRQFRKKSILAVDPDTDRVFYIHVKNNDRMRKLWRFAPVERLGALKGNFV